MRNRTKLAIGAAAGVATLGVGLGATQMAVADPTPTPGSTTQPSTAPSGEPGNRGPGGKHGAGLRGIDTAALAEKLGVSEDKLKTALAEIGKERSGEAKPSQPPSEADREARQAEQAKALAEKLGIDEAKVTAALEELRESRQADHKEQLQQRLDQAVKDGKLTQAEADAVLKAFDAGVLNGR